MQATFTFCLSEAAQRAQMMATGQPVARKQTTTEDVPVDWLTSRFCNISPEGRISFDLTQATHISENGRIGSYSWNHVGPELDAQPASGLEALQTLTDAIVAECAKQSAAYAVRQAEIAEENKRRAVEEAQRQARWAEEKRVKDEADAIAKIAADAKEALKTAAIDAFVAASGDAMLIQQHEDGLLCRRTIIARMAGAAFDAAGLPAAVSRPPVCEDVDCPCRDHGVSCIPPEVYARWKAITGVSDTAALAEFEPPAAELTVEFHSVRQCNGDGNYDDDEDRAGPVEYHAVVTIQSGPFEFVRRILL